MTNKITLSRELAERLDSAHSYVRNAAREELRAALASQHVVCSAGILCQNRECKECGGNGSYIPPLAEPVPPTHCEHGVKLPQECDLCAVPPAGGEPEDPNSAWEDTFGPHYEDDSEPVEVVAIISTEPKERGHYFTPDELRRFNRTYKSTPARGYTVELVDRAHVTLLQAEVERLNLQLETITADRDAEKSMKAKARSQRDKVTSELTKARELVAVMTDAELIHDRMQAAQDLKKNGPTNPRQPTRGRASRWWW